MSVAAATLIAMSAWPEEALPGAAQPQPPQQQQQQVAEPAQDPAAAH
jgi:hypothetical protein